MSTSEAQRSPDTFERLKPDVLHDYEHSDLTVAEIAEKHQLSTHSVIRWARDAGLKRKRGRRPIPRQVLDAAYQQLRAEHLSVREAAQQHGISPRTLSVYARERGFQPTNEVEQEHYDELKPQVLDAYQAGSLTLQQISERFGISTSTIANWAKQAGLRRVYRHKTKPAERAAALEDFRSSALTLREIAEKHGVSLTSVRNWVREEGLTREVTVKHPRSRAKSKVVRDYRKGKLTVTEIAEKHGVTLSSVTRWAREAGLSRRQNDQERIQRLRPRILHDYVTSRKSVRGIAEAYGVSQNTVRTLARDAGLSQADRPAKRS